MHYFDLPIFMIRFDFHWPIRFCSSGHTNQIPPSPNQLSLSLSLTLDAVIQATPLLLVIANAAIDLLFPLFTLSSLSLSLSKLILSFTTFLSLDHSSHSLLFSFFFSFSIWYVLGPKGFFFSPSNFSRSPPPKSDQISAVGLQGVVKKVLPLAGGIGR